MLIFLITIVTYRGTRSVRFVRDLSAVCCIPAAGKCFLLLRILLCIRVHLSEHSINLTLQYCTILKYMILHYTTLHLRTHKYNKLVLAQHLDDLVESFLMSALHNGQVVYV